MKRSTLLTIAAVLAFAAFLLWSTLGGQKAECEVCVSFNGRSNCATASAPSEAEAARSAQNTACGVLAAGMAETINCGNAVPTRQQCRTT
ncbi:MAG TPA: hypothetical protein VFS07_08425 [Gemmatimonadales bacterium]|jgi:hypothetical protein|nr:hypothetical protein [Gemmatimonadales bacterium]